MRILWLHPNLLLPLDKGGTLGNWHLMRLLAERREITYLSFADPHTSPAECEGVREVCAHLQMVPRTDLSKGSPAFIGRAAVSWIADAPDAFAGAVVSLLRDAARRVQLERAARELVVARYDWSTVAGQREEALVTAAGKRTAVAA